MEFDGVVISSFIMNRRDDYEQLRQPAWRETRLWTNLGSQCRGGTRNRICEKKARQTEVFARRLTQEAKRPIPFWVNGF